MTISLQQLNTLPLDAAAALLSGAYEHSVWIAAQALQARPFASLAALKVALASALGAAPRAAQLALICAHPELAGKLGALDSLTAESAAEQGRVGLTHCTRDELARMQQLNADYRAKFGWPFIVAVRGERGTALTKAAIFATCERRLQGHAQFEFAECLRQINRIAELRLNDLFGFVPLLGNQAWDWAEALAEHSDPDAKANGQLTVTYLTEAHSACAQQLQAWMTSCGFDRVWQDAVGNVVGCYEGSSVGCKTLLTGSHFDTVRNGGKYDGRLGILVPMLCVRQLAQRGQRLPFAIEVVGFAEEEGQRYKATFLGSGALLGQFNPAWLEQIDADGVSMRAAMQQAGLNLNAIAAIKRDPAKYVGFVEVHIEQGPVLNALGLPLGVVTSINGSLRYMGAAVGVACHAGTTPMNQRSDAATAVAELALYVERRACADGDSVGTVGMLQVPNGSINVVPGRCHFSLDLRAPNDVQRDALVADVLQEVRAIGARRNVSFELEETLRAAAAPSAPAWQQRWERAVASVGAPLYRMPSGAGHDAMKLHEIMPQAMLFIRGQNSGISHNPLEATTSDDIELAIAAFSALLSDLSDLSSQ